MHIQKEDKTADHQEFDELYRKNKPEIYKFIRCRVPDREIARDVMQETFLVAYKKWDTVRGLSNPTGFLINIAKNKIKEMNKTLKKLECEVELEPDEYTVIEDGYGKVELDIVILKNLTEEEKRRFIRYFVYGCSISKMAKIEKISENNMSVRISRLRDKIAEIMSEDSSEGVAFDKKQKKFVRIDKNSPHIIKRDEENGDTEQKGKEQK